MSVPFFLCVFFLSLFWDSYEYVLSAGVINIPGLNLSSDAKGSIPGAIHEE